MYNYYSILCAGGIFRRRFIRLLRKNNERFLGIKMKKIALLLLVASLVAAFSGCALLEKIGIGGNKKVAEICEIANQSAPTKVITDVSFVTNAGDSLKGTYKTTTDGTNMIFEFDTQRLATPAESLELGNSDRFISTKGIVNYKDGVFFGAEGDEWRPGSGTTFDIKYNFDEKIFADATVSEDGAELVCTVSGEELISIIGTDLNAVGDVEITLTTNGHNLNKIVIKCATANGKFTISTSYTYNRQNLFPETEETEEAEK